MGAPEAVAAHVDRILLRKSQSRPTAVLYSDVEFGFDGGHHSLILDRAWEADLADWPWTREMLGQDQMIILSSGTRQAPHHRCPSLRRRQPLCWPPRARHRRSHS